MTPVALAAGVVAGASAAHAAANGSASGRVTVPDGGVPVISVELVKVPADPSLTDAYHWTRSDIETVRGAGSFTFSDVAPGTYTLKFMSYPGYATQWWGGVADRLKVRTFTVAAGQKVTGLTMALTPSATVAGRVKFPDGPVAGASVHVAAWQPDPTRPAGGHWEDAVIPSTVPVAADGTWTIRGLGSDRYRLAFLSPGESTVVWNHVAGHPNWRYVTPVAGKVTRLDDVPAPAAKKIVRVTGPKVTGKAKVGRTLTASKGTWRSSVRSKVTVKVQWETKKDAKAVKVKGATKSRLKVTKRLKGKKVRLKVTVTAAGHPKVVRTTAWSKKVA